MKNIKILFDSSVGLTKAEAENLGAAYVPIIITIDGKDYQDGINLDNKTLSEMMLESDKSVSTASVEMGALTEAFRESLKDAKHVVYVPLSKELSSTTANAVMVAKEPEFAGKVTVFEGG